MINIFYTLDKKYFTQLFLSLISLVKNTKEALNVTLLTLEVDEIAPNKPKVTEEQRALCEQLLKTGNPESKVNLVDVSDLFKKRLLPSVNVHNKFYHYFVTIRLVADLVPEIGDKVLYFDTDVFLNGDVKELYDIDNSKYEVIGRRDAGRVTNYIHSAVMLLNMKLIRQNGTFEKACERCRNEKIFVYLDMTALNRATKSKKSISTRYCSFSYNPDILVQHLCGVREGKLFLSKKWRHRIKPDEEELMLKKLPVYKKYYDVLNEYREKYPEAFKLN